MLQLHVVQLGVDDSVFFPGSPSDTLFRQRAYAKELEHQVAGAKMTYIALTRHSGLLERQVENLSLIPLLFRRKWHAVRLIMSLWRLHRTSPIHALAPQDVRGIGWHVLFFGWIYRIPVVGQIHYDFFSVYSKEERAKGGLLNRIGYRIGLFLLLRFDALRVVSSAVREGLQDRGLHREIFCIPVAVTLGTQFLSFSPEKVLEKKPDQPLVLFVGRLEGEKNLSAWLLVAEKVRSVLPQTKFRIIGDGNYRRQWEKECLRLGLSDCIEWVGAIPNFALAEHYLDASILLMTSLHEGFGRVFVEAALHGTCAVSTDVVGAKSIICHGKTGFIHDHADIEGLAESVKLLLSDPLLRHEMAIAFMKDIRQRFDPDRLRKEWICLLKNCALSGLSSKKKAHNRCIINKRSNSQRN